MLEWLPVWTELNLWRETERRWYRKDVSRGSPVTTRKPPSQLFNKTMNRRVNWAQIYKGSRLKKKMTSGIFLIFWKRQARQLNKDLANEYHPFSAHRVQHLLRLSPSVDHPALQSFDNLRRSVLILITNCDLAGRKWYQSKSRPHILIRLLRTL